MFLRQLFVNINNITDIDRLKTSKNIADLSIQFIFLCYRLQSILKYLSITIGMGLFQSPFVRIDMDIYTISIQKTVGRIVV